MVFSGRDQTPCILFVDDKDSLRTFVKKILEAEGYQVITTSNSVEALVLATDFPDSIDLLLTNMDMKIFHNGMELISCFNILRPETNILIMSESNLPENYSDLNFLPKPFSKYELIQAVKSICSIEFA